MEREGGTETGTEGCLLMIYDTEVQWKFQSLLKTHDEGMFVPKKLLFHSYFVFIMTSPHLRIIEV